MPLQEQVSRSELGEVQEPHVTFLPGIYYPYDLRQTIRRETEGPIESIGMISYSGHAIDLVGNAFIDAAKLFPVSIRMDWYTGRSLTQHYDWRQIIQAESNEFSVTGGDTAYFQKLKDGGVQVIVENIPHGLGKYFPFAGRHHDKSVRIGKRILYIGGIDLFDNAISRPDFMLKIEDERVVAAWERFYTEGKEHDMTIDITPHFRMLWDAGIGQSIIYDHQRWIVKKAQNYVLHTTQFVPVGRLLDDMIQKAKDRVPVYIILSNKEDMDYTKYPYRVFYDIFRKRIKGINNIIVEYYDSKIHSKLTTSDGLVACSGSQNGFEPLIRLRTREVAMVTTDPVLVSIHEKFAEQLLNHTYNNMPDLTKPFLSLPQG